MPAQRDQPDGTDHEADVRDKEPEQPVHVTQLADIRVDACGDASFPASDPPNWWSGI